MTACAPAPSTAARALDAADAAADAAGKPAADRGDDAPRCRLRPWRRRDRSAARAESARTSLIHGSGSGASIASFSPCTSWTTWPFWRSIEGISMSEPDRNAVRRAGSRFRSATLVFGVVKDRRGQRRVGVAAREDVGEVVEAAGAARGDDRDVHGVGRPRRSSRSRSRPWCRRGPSTSAGSRRRRAIRPRAPTRPRRARRRPCRCARRRAKPSSRRLASMATMTAWLP